MKVTQIVPLSKNNCIVYFLNWEELLLSKSEIKQYKIIEGMDMELDTYQYLTQEIVIPKARQKAFNYLSYRNRSIKEMRDYLKKQGFSPSIIETVMDFLSHYSYVDDYEYARSFIRSKEASKPYGKKALRYLLLQKGISSDIVESVLDERLENAEVENCYKLIQKRAKLKAISFEERGKHIAYLQRRGFSYYTINEAFKLYDIHIKDTLL